MDGGVAKAAAYHPAVDWQRDEERYDYRDEQADPKEPVSQVCVNGTGNNPDNTIHNKLHSCNRDSVCDECYARGILCAYARCENRPEGKTIAK